ncbi:MAG: rhodanese-like domain-containing protein [Proteobacteria bacterium]|jgi:rhodanese-related sulfurtransferase|nr:rhodanese-like domain-containing protein [Pseudomonadota bacterium]MBK8957594.1 rhodanese-like domain-containing protein [Pseudomonadota bacterium]
MSHSIVTPLEVSLRIAADGAATYVDVRTVAEFVTGHPRGRVINVPIEFYHPKTEAAHANASFALVMEHTLPLDTPLIVGADEGPRAEAAADALRAAGYGDVSVMSAGLPGWRAAGLPVTGNNADGVSYVSLLTPAKRKGAPAAEHH